MAFAAADGLMLSSECELRILGVVKDLPSPATRLMACLAGWRATAIGRKLLKAVSVAVLLSMAIRTASLWLALPQPGRMTSDAVNRTVASE